MYQDYRLRAVLLCIGAFLFLNLSSESQVVAGIRANGRSTGHGDTIRVCVGNSITYQSIAQGSLSILWQFNNGSPTTATGIGPHIITYNSIGIDTTFQWVNGGGFEDSTFLIVEVSDVQPIAGFNFSPNDVCGNIFVNFTNTSNTGEPLSYLWDFGDGSTSAEESPSHQFLTATGLPGSQVFNVNMTVTNVHGCQAQSAQPVTIRKVPDASIGNGDPSVIFGPFNGIHTFKRCNNIPAYNFKFTNISATLANNTSYRIEWGDGTDSVFTSWPAGQVIGHTFPLGSSTMTVSVNGPDGCIGIKEYIIFLGTSPAGGLASLGNTDICSSDSLRFVINNFANNPPGTTYSFFTNENFVAQVFQHPPPSIVSHFFNAGSCGQTSSNGTQSYMNSFGAYLTIENPCGSNSASVLPIYVSLKPRARISLPNPVVCVGNTTAIVNASSFGNIVTATGTFTSECTSTGINVWTIAPSTGYNLMSGTLGALNGSSTNGQLWTDGSETLNVQFNVAGTYTIKLYTYNNRCGMDSTQTTICVRNPPEASFSLAQNVSCGPVTLDLNNTSPTGTCMGENYQWDISYSDPLSCGTPGGTTFTYLNGTNATSISPTVSFSNPGQYIITLTTRANNSPSGCPPATFTDTVYIKSRPLAQVSPLAEICVDNDALPSATVNSCYVPGQFGYQWSFQNATPPTSDQLSPGNIQFNATGLQLVQLIVTDSSCMLSDTVSTQINVVPKPNAEAGTGSTVCSGEVVPIGMMPDPGVSYQWTPAAGLSSAVIANPMVTLIYEGPSTDTVLTYYLTSSLGPNCSSLDSVKFVVKRKPNVSISPIAPQICIGGSTLLTASGADTYVWAPTTGLSSQVDPAVTATPAITTTYTVTGMLANGCSASASSTVTVHPDADANFLLGDTVRCAPLNIDTLINNIHFPEGNGTYNWYANGVLIGSNSSGSVPSYLIPNPSMTVTIKLVTLSANGCKPDSMQRTIITVPTVLSSFTKDRDSSCTPLVVNFTNTSSELSGIDFLWDFGNGIVSTDVQPGPVQFDASPEFRDTVYYIELRAANNCNISIFRDSVKVFPNAKARFGVDTTRGCSPFTATITNNSMGNNFAYYWDFGDGTLDTTFTNSTFDHTYFTGLITNYTIRLIAENQCSRDTQEIVLVVTPNEIEPNITTNGNQLMGCAPMSVTFNNSTTGASQLTWDFGDNTPSLVTPNSQSTINHTYANPGNYTVTIRLENDCSDTTITRNVVVYAPPVADFTASPLRVCPGQEVIVANNSTNSNSHQWLWGDNTSSSFLQGQHIYQSPGTYEIMLVETRVHPSGFSCTDTARRMIEVVQKIPAQIQVEPGSLCSPYHLSVNAGSISGYQSISWVIKDSSTSQGVFHFNGPSASHIFSVPGVYAVKLIVQTTGNCIDSTELGFEVHPTPKVSFSPVEIITCSVDTLVNFTAVTSEAGDEPVHYTWFVNNSIEGNDNPFSHQFSAPYDHPDPVQFTIRALAQNATGCGDTSLPAHLIMQPLPIPRIGVSPSTVIQQPDYTFSFTDSVATNPNKNYVWYPDDPSLQTRTGRDVTYEYGDTGTYKVKLAVTDFTHGCSAIDSVYVTILYQPGYLHVPNAMCLGCSNNSLRQFLPLGKGLRTYRLRIYTAWGQKIFETTRLNPDGSPSEPWDGKFRGEVLQQDAYTWQIEATYLNGTEWKGMKYPGSNKYIKTGFITLIK